MLELASTLSAHVRFLLQSLNDANADSVRRELSQFLGYGVEGSIVVLQTCLDYLNLHKADLKNFQVEAVIASTFKYAMEKPNFCTVFCQSLTSTVISEDFLENLSKVLLLSLSEKIGIGLALSDCENLVARMCGKKFCVNQIEEVNASPDSVDSYELIQNIIMFLQCSEGLSKHVDNFMQMLSLVQVKDVAQFVLTPILSDELRETNFIRNMDSFHESAENDFDAILAEMEKEMGTVDIMRELGYGCTVDASLCKEILSLCLPLTEMTIARILGMIACTHAGLEDNSNTFSSFSMALGCNSSSDLPPLGSWNIDVLIKTIKQLAPATDWIRVVENLDHEGFYIPNEVAFSFFMSAYRHACQEPFPLHAICGSLWKNTEGQLSFLKYAVLSPPEVFTFVHSGRQLDYNIDSVPGHKLQLGDANHAWLCLDLLEVLCKLAERGHARTVNLMLEYPLKNCPEVLLLGMAHINTAYNLLQNGVTSTVFPMIIKNSMATGMILHLWRVNPYLLLRGLVQVHNTEPDSTIRIVEICQELKILSTVLEMIPFSFGIRLAIVASKKELLDLENWLNDNLNAYKDIFFEECLKFLKEIQFSGSQDFSGKPFHLSSAVLNIYLETTSTFFKVLKAHAGLISSPQLLEEMEKLQATITDSNPKLQNGGITDSSTSDGYGDDIEAEANSYFHQMFSGRLTIDAMVQMLVRFKESSRKREQSIFECMIANLFEGYRFFPEYPERQLKIAAVLFGSVIKHQLVTHLTLGIALRGVLDALRKPADSKMFLFGTKALEQFVDRLIEWPQYCNHILQISHLRATHSELVAFIECALARISSGHLDSDGGSNPSIHHHATSQANSENGELSGSSITQPGQLLSPSVQLQQKNENSFDDRNKALTTTPSMDVKPLVSSVGQPSVPLTDASSVQKNAASAATLSTSPGFVCASRGATSIRFGSALNIETLVAAAERKETPIEAPASEVQDKISFIINNISAANIEAKAKEFTEILKEQYYPWFAQYMVMKRASIEPNFHYLYLKFLDKVNSKALNKEIVQATYENCKVLLGSELIKSSSEERSLLKNLGSWLGKLTIGRNQVLRAREINPKSLIIEACEKGLMIAVIPFTSKILESCQSSLAYQPPNPWTMGILGLLAEIYSMPNLKMNLKFDIEVLYKNLGVDMKDITPTSLLKDRKREIEGNPDFSNKDVGVSQPQMVAEVKSGIISPLHHVELPLEVANPPNSGGHAHLLSQHPPLHLSSGTLMEDEKLVALGLSDHLPSAQGLFQATPSQSHFSASLLSTPIPNIGTHVIINQKISALGLHLHFQRVVPIVMDRAIKEIVSGIVQRSVSIATQTTKELVLKDYAMESDETRIYNAAHLMVASLAGSLAHVTCKEPLHGSISSQLRSTLQGLNVASDLLEQAVQLVTNDNLDLGCAVIEQAATDKAIQTIDGEIAQQLSLRRKHRDPSFFDPIMYGQGSMGIVPEALRPKPGHLSLSQQRVYEDFVRLPWQNQSSQSTHAMSGGSSSVPGDSALTGIFGSTSGQVIPGYSSSLVNSGPLDVASEAIESTSAALLSVSTIQVGAAASLAQQSTEHDTLDAAFSLATSASDLHSVDAADVVKESIVLQPLPSPAATEHHGSNISEASLSTRDALDKYLTVAQKLETLVMGDATESEIQGVISEVPEIILRCVSRDEAALAVAQKVFKGLYENASNSLHVSAHLAILAALRDVCKLAVKELTSWVIYSDEEHKFNKDITVGLIQSELLNLAGYNVHMAKLIDGGRNKAATEFAISLLQTLVTNESRVISDLHNLVDALAKLAAKPGSSELLQQLVDMIRNPSANVATLSGVTLGKEDKARQPKDKKAPGHLMANKEENSNVETQEPDPAGFREQVSMLFAEWYQVCELPAASGAACTHYIIQLHQNGLLKGDEMTERFFRILTELSVAHFLSSEVINSGTLQLPQQAQSLSFLAIDIYAKLVLSIYKYYPVEQGSSKIFLLSKILTVTVRLIQKDAEEKKSSFNPRPYFRLFINWLLDIGSLDPTTDGANFQILTAFANAFHALQPLEVPAFCFAWLELVSHRSFMPKLLAGNAQKGWPYVQRLLVDLLQFLEPFLRNAELGVLVQFLYKGTLRVLLVLLHDFPEFLCDYHFTFCDVIPPSCIQMRNIILSAFPRNMRLPDPSTPNLKIDLLPEIRESPRILSEVDATLKVKQMKSDVDEHLKTRQQGSSFLTELKQRLLLPPSEVASAVTRYNVPLINSLVLYVGMQAIQQLQARAPHAQSAANTVPLAAFRASAALDIFQILIFNLDTEGRYLFLNAIANQLRYPNNHTHYFSFILLYLFAESEKEIIQEQITRVLLERLIVNKPHPWGLLITFTELIKNPRYNFWNQSFIRCAPEIEKLFESVARSCGGLKPVDESVVSGCISDNTHCLVSVSYV